MINLTNVSKVYLTGQREVRALDDLSLQINQGEFVAVRGPSGCGKSTLLALAGGLALPTSGRVTVADQLVSSMSASDRAEFRLRSIGFVFQMFHLLPYLSVVDNVLVAAPEARSDLKQKAEELLTQFGLADRLKHRPGQLSTGERQRVAMARAMLNEPALLLADEPTGNLDPENAHSLLDLLGEFHSAGGTILLVTHDDRAASRAERTILLRQGKLDPVAEVAS
jgi:putative ABC transport system ATP-binding protein